MKIVLPKGFSVTEPELQFLEVRGARGRRRIAMLKRAGRGPAVLWFGGFRSDMTSTKAARIDAWCASEGRAMVRMDYAGHGASEGRFADHVVSDWVEDAEAVLRGAADGPAVVVGSSMGGWIATLIAKRLAERGDSGLIAGLVLIAPACDFTETLMWPQFPDVVKAEIMEKGVFQLCLRLFAGADAHHPRAHRGRARQPRLRRDVPRRLPRPYPPGNAGP